MEWSEVRVTTDARCAEAVADIFHEWGAGGVIIEDPASIRSYVEQEIWDAHGFDQDYLDRKDVVVRAFYALPGQVTSEQLARMQNVAGPACQIHMLTVRDEDWADNWKAYYHPTRVGEHIIIRPTWEECPDQEGDVTVVLDPGMAFGTGTHITTRQCLELLEEAMVPGMRVVDVGTGSGILAIAAAKLGAAEVLAIDLDPTAVAVAQENVLTNEVASRVRVELLDLADLTAQNADLVIANLTAPVLTALVQNLALTVRPGGQLIGAGIGREQWPELENLLGKHFDIEKVATEGDWVAILLRRA